MNAGPLRGSLLASDESAMPTASIDATGRGAFDNHNAMCLLFRRARAHLSDDDLGWLAIHGSDYAEATSRNAAFVAEGIGALVSGDMRPTGESNIGCFQSNHDVPTLMFHLAAVFSQVAGLVNVSGEAANMLIERRGSK